MGAALSADRMHSRSASGPYRVAPRASIVVWSPTDRLLALMHEHQLVRGVGERRDAVATRAREHGARHSAICHPWNLVQQVGDQSDFLSDLVADWVQSARPLMIVDEVRAPHPALREIVAFVIVCTDTRTAVNLADTASRLREAMRPHDGVAVIKGSDLYGNRTRRHHDPFRRYVTDALSASTAIVRVATTSPTITRYLTLSPGGIRREAGDAATTLSPIRGRELVPLMNMVKAAATALGIGATQVDVVVDRSAQLGLAPDQLGIAVGDLAVLGPSTLNVRGDGSPAEFSCPASFRFLSTAEETSFRDLLLLPDAVGYAMRSSLASLASQLATKDFIVDVLGPDQHGVPTIAKRDVGADRDSAY